MTLFRIPSLSGSSSITLWISVSLMSVHPANVLSSFITTCYARQPSNVKQTQATLVRACFGPKRKVRRICFHELSCFPTGRRQPSIASYFLHMLIFHVHFLILRLSYILVVYILAYLFLHNPKIIKLLLYFILFVLLVSDFFDIFLYIYI